MATRNDRFPSKYLKASDLNGDTLATIAQVVEELLGEEKQSKPVAYFREEHVKPYPLNVTNWDFAAALSGKADDKEWAGLRVLLVPTRVMFKKELRDTIRFAAPPSTKRQAPSKPSIHAVADEEEI
jgi:hypothetical protein